ncbi:MAG: hypothetical protein M0Z71_08655 [Nitrospiraceae bacterium]|nr:hypothetical protein [Nitrospiraceae bacterium]
MYKKPIARADRLKDAIQSAEFNVDSRKRRLQQNVFLAWWAGFSIVLIGASTMAYFSPSALVFFTASGVDLGMSQHGEVI